MRLRITLAHRLRFLERLHYKHMITKIQERQTLFLLIAGLTVSGLLFLLKYLPHGSQLASPIGIIPITQPTPTPTIDPETQVQLSSQDSPDGKAILTMRKQKKNEEMAYAFLTSTTTDPTQKEIFTKTVPKSQTIKIPFNAFSPDNHYVFLTENTGTQTNYYVFQANGDPIGKDIQPINITDLFIKKLPNFTLVEATGWASETLVVLNANKLDGSQGPSFWFDVPSQTFIQLSTKFH